MKLTEVRFSPPQFAHPVASTSNASSLLKFGHVDDEDSFAASCGRKSYAAKMLAYQPATGNRLSYKA